MGSAQNNTWCVRCMDHHEGAASQDGVARLGGEPMLTSWLSAKWCACQQRNLMTFFHFPLAVDEKAPWGTLKCGSKCGGDRFSKERAMERAFMLMMQSKNLTIQLFKRLKRSSEWSQDLETFFLQCLFRGRRKRSNLESDTIQASILAHKIQSGAERSHSLSSKIDFIQ